MKICPSLPEHALSIRQPWGWAILNAGKNIENRSRRFNYRGPICLHASLHRASEDEQAWFFATLDDVDIATAQSCCGDMTNTEIKRASLSKRGGIIGTADIVDCIATSKSPWFTGPYGLVLENVKPVPFVSVKGALGLFKWRSRL